MNDFFVCSVIHMLFVDFNEAHWDVSVSQTVCCWCFIQYEHASGYLGLKFNHPLHWNIKLTFSLNELREKTLEFVFNRRLLLLILNEFVELILELLFQRSWEASEFINSFRLNIQFVNFPIVQFKSLFRTWKRS